MKAHAIAVAVALSVTLVLAPAIARSEAAAPRASLLDVESAVMCVSCHEPLVEVSSPQALAEKHDIQVLIAAGDTKAQILRWLVAQYGPGVLAKPPASGFSLLVYVLPAAILAGGLAFLLVTLPRWRARGRAVAPLHGAQPLSPDDARRLDEDLARPI
jgi:cytochrome c-type biogenesis protein CcmH